jgi:hypothetical protein
VVSAGDASALPVEVETGVFRSPDSTGTAITLATGDSVYPLTIAQICKTDLEISIENGTIDVTDDCTLGFVTMILDGFTTISGSLNGFLKVDSITKKIVQGLELLGRYFDTVEDDGLGGYVVTPHSNEQLLLMICLNKDAKIDEYQNWLILPVYLPTLGTGAGLKEAQKRDLTFVQGEGVATYYVRKVISAADEL